MQSGIAKTSPRYLAGMITASLVEICFGTIWGLAAASGRWIAFLPISIMAVGLLAFCITTRQAVRRLPQEQETPEDHVRGRQVSRRYVVVVAAEVLAIAVTVILLRLIKYPAGIAPAICLIVGLHFLPLAVVFQRRLYILIGAVLSLLGGGALLAAPASLTPDSWPAIVGLGAAGVLWLASLYNIMEVRRVLHLRPATGLA